MRDDLDRFYTPEITVSRCCAQINSLGIPFDLVVEPSAGAGAFLDQYARTIAFDLLPSHQDVIEHDFLTVTRTLVEEIHGSSYSHLLILGNPPFGKRSTLAKKFITHSINELGAKSIAFVLPRTFNKRLMQKVFPEQWRLISVTSLTSQESTFDLQDDSQNVREIFIPCDFFIWTQSDSVLPEVNLRAQAFPAPKQIIFVQRGSKSADFTINGNSGVVRYPSQVTNPKAEHYVKVAPGYSVESVMDLARGLNYDFHSSVNGGVAWINKDDIAQAFYESGE